MSKLNYASFFEKFCIGAFNEDDTGIANALLGCIFLNTDVMRTRKNNEGIIEKYSWGSITPKEASNYKTQKTNIAQNLVNAVNDEQVKSHASAYFREHVLDCLDEDKQWDVFEELIDLINTADNIPTTTRIRFQRLAECLTTEEEKAAFLSEVFLFAVKQSNKLEKQQGTKTPKCLTIIPSVNQTVGLIGREDIISTLRHMLEEGNRKVLVYGVGGIGKTAVMLWICNRLKDEGKLVAWIPCGFSIKNDLLVLRDILGIPKDIDSMEACTRIITNIDTELGGELYLFLDNIRSDISNEEIDIINSLNAHVMITTRAKNNNFPNLKIDVLELDDSVDMFCKYYNEFAEGCFISENEETVPKIVSLVNRHPLLVELLAKAAWKKGGTLKAFDQSLKENGVYDVYNRTIETKHDVKEKMTIEECVIKLYLMTSLSVEQQRIMKLFSIFSPDKEIFYKIAEWADFDMDALDELVDLAWLGRGYSEGGYTIHQIIRDSLVRQMLKQDEDLNFEDYGELLERVIDTDSYLHTNLNITKVQHRKVIAEDIASYLWKKVSKKLYSENNTTEDKKNFVICSDLYEKMVDVYCHQAEYMDALMCCDRALKIRESIFGIQNPKTAEIYNKFGNVYSYQKNLKSASFYYKIALEIRKQVLGADDPKTADSYSNLANVYRNLQMYDDALQYFKKALIIHEQKLGKDNPKTAKTYNNIGNVFADKNDLIKALWYYNLALTISNHNLSTDDLFIASLHNNIGNIFANQEKFKKAFKHYKMALKIQEQVLSKDHPETASTYSNIAKMFTMQGNYEEALDYFEKAREINERFFGKNHVNTTTIYIGIGDVFRAQNNYEMARQYYVKAGVEYSSNNNTFGYKHHFASIDFSKEF